MEEISKLSKRISLTANTDERIASHCVCCGSDSLNSSPAIIMPFISHRAFAWKPMKIDKHWGLKTIQPGMAYGLCNSLMCDNCNLLFMDIRFTANEMTSLYRDYRGEEYTKLREYYEPGYSLRNQELAQPLVYLKKTEEFIAGFVQNPQAILDWGGDTGINTPFKSVANIIDIYDISDKIGADGSSVTNKTKLLNKSFDLITCSNVLEHVPHPVSVLTQISEFMSKSTKLFIEVPFESLMIRGEKDNLLSMKRHWHEHINFFSEKSIICLLARSNFNILSMRSIPTNEKGNQSNVFQIICDRK